MEYPDKRAEIMRDLADKSISKITGKILAEALDGKYNLYLPDFNIRDDHKVILESL